MQLLYVDPSLRSNRGHHANIAAALTESFRRRGDRVSIAASRSKFPDIEGEKVFTDDVYRHMKRDPGAWRDKWRMQCAVAKAFYEILPVLKRVRPDLIYAHSANAVVVEGVLRAMESLYVPTRQPRLVVELPYPSEPSADYFYGKQLRSLFAKLKKGILPLDLVVSAITVDIDTSARLSDAIDYSVGVMPSPYRTTQQKRLTADEKHGRIVVGTVGHQSVSKGFDMLPEIISHSCLRSHDIHWIVQHQPESEQETLQQLCFLKSQGYCIELINEDLTRSEYEMLLQRIDVVLLAYQPERYQSAISGVCYEAISQGSVLVVPEPTTIGRITKEFQPHSPQFYKWTPNDIAKCLQRILTDFIHISRAAISDATVYRATNGPDAYANAVIAQAISPEPRLHGGNLRQTMKRLIWSVPRILA